jgi:hypothetical protein
VAPAPRWVALDFEVQTNPGKFHDKTVTVEGVVTTRHPAGAVQGLP